jgi:hypothetical protein
MDEPAQCCCIDYVMAANVVRCWQLYVGRALVTAKILNFGVERSKNVHGERILNKYFNQILQRNFTYVPMVLKRKIWWMSANPDTHKCVGIKIVSAGQGLFGQKC